MKHFALKRRLNHINCLVLCWLFKKYFTLNSKKLFWSGRTKWFVLTHLHHISAEHKVWTLLKNSKKARGLHQLGVSKSKAIDFSLRENNVSVKFLRIHRARMLQWRNFTLDTLINQQDCAVEAVKLERLLMSDIKKKWVLFAVIVNTFVKFHGYSR